LSQYDGRGPDKRILVAVNGKVFDVTKNGGPYASFAGRDVSRALACFMADESFVRTTYDDLSDLSVEQLDRLKEWERQFIGKILGVKLFTIICCKTSYGNKTDS
uniref:Cytochrome b5 heme-binding domain-containing protein n=1 Tax=Echinostoma caproni TaxID=27848 RepID=A0A183AU14_9TREM